MLNAQSIFCLAKKDGEFKKPNTELIRFPSAEVICKGKCIGWIKQKLKMNVPFPIVTHCMEDIETAQYLFLPIKKVRVFSIMDMSGYIRLRIYYPKFIDIQVENILGTIKALQSSENNCAEIIKY